MISRLQLTAAVAALTVVAACAQQEEPMSIAPEPVFNKFGDIASGTCEEGYIYVPGAQPVPICIPEDECDDYVAATGQPLVCPPPGRTFQRGDDNDSTPRQPTGAAPNQTTAPRP